MGVLGSKKGGRTYPVHIVSRHPWRADALQWVHNVECNTELENALCIQKRAEGYDCIISLAEDDRVYEIIVLDDRIIKRLDADIQPLNVWDGHRVGRLAFWQIENWISSEYDSDSVLLFSSQSSASEYGICLPGRPVYVNTVHPFHCEEIVWPELNYGLLRDMDIDCLVDPRNGRALVTNPSKIMRMNRSEVRKRASRDRARRKQRH